MRRARFAHRGALGGAVLVALFLGGCASTPPYDATVASALQTQVATITTASADGEWESALTHVQALEADARDAHARGEISTERLDSILAAIELVRLTLDAEREAEEAAAAEALRAEEEAQAEAERQAEIERAAAEARTKAAEEAEKRAQEEAEREREREREEEEREREEEEREKEKDKDDDEDDD